MIRKVLRLFVGAAALVGVGAVFQAPGTPAYAVEDPASGITLPFSGLHTEKPVLVAQAEAASTPVSYAAAQADRGKKAFARDCEDCHGKDLRGGLLGGPPLRGQSFEKKYGSGAPAGVLFDVMSATMPPNAPGSYSANVYADLMAHILKTNGYKAGGELPSDSDALYDLTMKK